MPNSQSNGLVAFTKADSSEPPLEIPALLQAIEDLSTSNQGRKALDYCEQWLHANANIPLSFAVWHTYGVVLHSMGEMNRAVFAFQAALEQNPLFVSSALALSSCLEAQGNLEQADLPLERALQSRADRVTLLNNLGRLAADRWDHERAENFLAESLALQPLQHDVLVTLVLLRQRLCRWPTIPSEWGLADDVLKYFGPLSALAEFNDPQAHLEVAKNFTQAKFPEVGEPLVQAGQLYPNHEKVRVGFLSPDFRLHATSVFFAPLLERLNRESFTVWALDITPSPDEGVLWRKRLLGGVDHHLPLQGLSATDAAKAIKTQEIDILIDMGGMSGNARPDIVALRPAPIQVSYLGFLGSCGNSAIDYIFAAKDMLLEEEAEHYQEKPLYLPNAYVPIELIVEPHLQYTKADCQLPDDAFVFCALLNPYKIRPDVFDAWLRILTRTPQSILWLITDSQAQKNNLLAYAKKHGIDNSRLVFASRMQPSEYRAKLGLADLFLDTTPYGSGATARDAILANLPVLTCAGRSMMSRFSAHLMNLLGLSDFVVSDLAQYEEFAFRMASDPVLLKDYKIKMAQALELSELFSIDQFANDFESALKSVIK